MGRGFTSDAASQAIFGGELVGEDLGYDPPRLLPAANVRAVSEQWQSGIPNRPKHHE